MTEFASSTASPTARSLAPVSAAERITTLDVLRGIALLGVVIANVWLWFSGVAFRFPGTVKSCSGFLSTRWCFLPSPSS